MRFSMRPRLEETLLAMGDEAPDVFETMCQQVIDGVAYDVVWYLREDEDGRRFYQLGLKGKEGYYGD